MKKTVGLLVIAPFILNSCTKNSIDITVSDFPVSGELISDTIRLDNAELLSAMVYTAGDFLVFADKAGDYNYSIYDKSFAFVDTIIRRGSGPDDLIASMYFGQWTGSASNPEIYALSPFNSRIVSLNINPFDKLNNVLEFPQSDNLMPNFVTVVCDTLTVGLKNDPSAATQIFAYNQGTGSVSLFDDSFEYNENNRFYVSQKSLAVNGKGEGYCEAYFCMPWIVIRDNNFNVIRRVAIDKAVDAKTITDDFGGDGNGFTAVKYYGDHIVALYNERGDNPKSRLLVFALNGDPGVMPCGLRSTINNA